jgi:hypothetical protein
MSDLKSKQIRDSYDDLLTKGSGTAIEDGDGNAFIGAIVNNLTSTATTAPLAANQGKVLNERFKILQVVHASTDTEVSTTANNTFIDTGLSATITPSATSSKIFVIVKQAVNINNGTATGETIQGNLRLLRGSTAIVNDGQDSGGGRGLELVASPNDGSLSLTLDRFITALDSPNTTSATTYKTQGMKRLTNHVLMFQPNFNVHNNFSQITLIEVAG